MAWSKRLGRFELFLMDWGILEKVQLIDSKAAFTPLTSGKNLSKFDGSPFTDAGPYSSLVGVLQYCILTRPDISYAMINSVNFFNVPLMSIDKQLRDC